MAKTKVEITKSPIEDIYAPKEMNLGEGPFFAGKRKISPAKVSGKYRSIKWAVLILALAVYYCLPWMRWDRGENLPDQAILIDIIGRKFYFFFIELWPQEIYYFTGLLLLAALSLFFMTALAGRVWCGYLCFQTIWTDLFIAIEHWVEGDRHRRIRLDQAPWTFRKIRLRITKHFLWLMVGLATGGAWVFYFNDAPTLWNQFIQGEFPLAPTFWMIFLTLTTYMFAGHARELVCTYMCPYARFQGAMFDEDTLIVTYDEARGEPRGKDENSGDCVDCNRCVAVCPTGIDIRNGQQYTCITCAQCIDACNAVMTKLGRETGLIRYDTLNNSQRRAKGLDPVFKIIRPRTIIYPTIISLVGFTMLYQLTVGRPMTGLNVVRDRNPMYVMMSDGSVRNNYTLRILNKTHEHQTYLLEAQGIENARFSTPQIRATEDKLYLDVPPASVKAFRLFIEAPDGNYKSGSNPLEIKVKAGGKRTDQSYSTSFVAPKY